ncbi:MAG: hypothetical protein HY598_04870 [Candidatus Omnitrophica bacterium]|nr:hypothetical protein [Candidatus Omnitrophota bacterium]
MLFVAGGTILGRPDAADACSCEKPSMVVELKRASMVFIGQVMRIKQTGEQNSFHESKVIVTLNPTRFWKGPQDTRRVVLHTVRNQVSCDGFWFEDGKTYLVVAHQQPDGTVGTSFCSGTEVIDKATENIAALDQLTAASDHLDGRR